MSHYTVTVALPASTDQATLDDRLEAALAPFDEGTEVPAYTDEDGSETTYNPRSKWDWWKVGGRWHGYFPLRDGWTPDEVVIGSPSWWTNEDKVLPPDRADGGRVRVLDFDRLRAERDGKGLASYAYLDIDGEWHEPSPMGWFGVGADDTEIASFEPEYEQWIATLDPETLLVVVDCHI